MKVTVVGTGYVGLVTGVALAEIGNQVICLDIDEEKVQKLRSGVSPIYEPGLEELIDKNVKRNRLFFMTNKKEAYSEADVVYIAVGTPQKSDGSPDLSYVVGVAFDIASSIRKDTMVVIKSTVPVGTNHLIREIIGDHLLCNVKVEVVSNPEFLREGSAVFDTFHGDRIVIGVNSEDAAKILMDMYKPFKIPVMITDVLSAEMIKYTANAFLATKISFINEISQLCESFGARVDEVAKGIGMDQRIGRGFLNAGIGYGGSCFPKDTAALMHMAQKEECPFSILHAVQRVNNKQPVRLLEKVRNRLGNLKGRRIAVLGLAFKPNTDDIREAPAITICHLLRKDGATILAYDPVAMNHARNVLDPGINLVGSTKEALLNADAVLILTEWEEFRRLNFQDVVDLMKEPIIFDGRNCFDLTEMESYDVEYISMGRPTVSSRIPSLNIVSTEVNGSDGDGIRGAV